MPPQSFEKEEHVFQSHVNMCLDKRQSTCCSWNNMVPKSVTPHWRSTILQHSIYHAGYIHYDISWWISNAIGFGLANGFNPEHRRWYHRWCQCVYAFRHKHVRCKAPIGVHHAQGQIWLPIKTHDIGYPPALKYDSTDAESHDVRLVNFYERRPEKDIPALYQFYEQDLPFL